MHTTINFDKRNSMLMVSYN